MCHNVTMPSVNLRQLRDTRRLKAWLRAGNTVELRERERVIAAKRASGIFSPVCQWRANSRSVGPW